MQFTNYYIFCFCFLCLYFYVLNLVYFRQKFHELIDSDILYEIIEGTFKDHFAWLEKYIKKHYTNATSILPNIDCW